MNVIGSNNIFSNYIKTLVNDNYNIRSGYAYYDSITHYYLGRYLRDYKNSTGIDLTCFYNCYSENMISKYRLNVTPNKSEPNKLSYEVETKAVSQADGYDLVYINVLPKDVLTLYFESNLPITMCVAAYNGMEFTDTRFDNVQVIPSCRLDKPYVYNVPDYNTDQRDNSYRVDNLVLLIQLPKTCYKRIIFLGDYSDSCERTISYDSMPSDEHIIPDISAFIVNGRSQGFTDDLIAYITEYAITEKDSIFSNILRVQNQISSYGLKKSYNMRYKAKIIDGELDLAQREWLKEFKAKNLNNYNNIGRIDKDIEELLDRGGTENV